MCSSDSYASVLIKNLSRLTSITLVIRNRFKELNVFLKAAICDYETCFIIYVQKTIKYNILKRIF